jgi:hypothetical protein
MKKQNKVFDEDYVAGKETTTETVENVSQQITPSRKEYSKDTEAILDPSNGEEISAATSSNTALEQKWGTSKPFRVVLRGK